MLNGEFEKALESYTKALELDPANKCCLVARSKCYLHIGDPMKALKVFFKIWLNYRSHGPYGSNNLTNTFHDAIFGPYLSYTSVASWYNFESLSEL